MKSASIQSIYKIASLINNYEFDYSGETYRFNTYTNVGIECFKDVNNKFYTFHDETVKNNRECKFALRITTRDQFAQRLFSHNREEGSMRAVMEPMEGLFGRYDFLIILSMEEFSKLYATLCESKITGSRMEFVSESKDGFLDIFRKGVMSGNIEIINERVLVPLENNVLGLACTEEKSNKESEWGSLIGGVKEENDKLLKKVKEFQQMANLFVEERRAFIDVSRELGEVVSTYAPQGVEYDSYVNWQILVSDLTVVFEGIDAWKKVYEAERKPVEQKDMREHFIEELRLITEALNQYYKFLQNVNAQTWQAPLYEIQTQLDAEKMMVAYREFLYQYLQRYRRYYDNTDDKRPMRYPIVYPDLSAEKVYVTVSFQNEKDLYKQLFVCKVPSFEYYGRMFDMIPWSLHEASHCIRVLSRGQRNKYIIKAVFGAVFSHVLYKLLNTYSNDYGYHGLGELENEVLECIAQSAVTEFKSYCSKWKGEKIGELAIGHLETELLEFLYIIFEQDSSRLMREDDTANVKEIQKALLRYLGRLGLLDVGKGRKGTKNWKNMVEKSADQYDVLIELFKEIYYAFYQQMTGIAPKENEWEIIVSSDTDFEEKLKKVSETLDKAGDGGAKSRDYCFNIRELNRLYGAWCKRRKKEDDGVIRNRLWKRCIPHIRNKVNEGFQKNQGFQELYRILHMVFDCGEDEVEEDVAKRIGKEFDRLIRQEVKELTEREVTLYRETTADIFMTEALGLNVFGYCRHMFQTASDASIENSVNWVEAINVHRFRSVVAVLLKQESDVEVRTSGNKKIISMNKLLTDGEKFCYFTLDCAQEKINSKLKEGQEEKKALITKLFKLLNANIKNIFMVFMQSKMVVRETLEDSALNLLIDPKHFDEPCEEKIAYRRKRIRVVYEEIKDEVQEFVHIFYRVRCFISILALVGEKGYIVIEKNEYDHLTDIYKKYGKVCQETREEEICRVVSEYYNTPQSAKDKSTAEMLEDTLRFIQIYYYRNRFNMMSSMKKYRGEERDGETNCS